MYAITLIKKEEIEAFFGEEKSVKATQETKVVFINEENQRQYLIAKEDDFISYDGELITVGPLGIEVSTETKKVSTKKPVEKPAKKRN